MEQGTHKPLVVGSSPTLATDFWWRRHSNSPKQGKTHVKLGFFSHQDLPNGRFLSLIHCFSPIADFAKSDEQIGIPRDSFFLFLLQSPPVKGSQPTVSPALGKHLYCPYCCWFDVNRGYGLILAQPISALDQLYQPPCKAVRRSPVDHIVVKHHCQVEDLAWLDTSIHYGWLPGSATRARPMLTYSLGRVLLQDDNTSV